MKKSFYIIIISVFAFIAVNSIFYIIIYNRQLDFQTELLSHQIRICGNIIEQNGLNFENEVNFILFSEDISRLFSDPDIKEKGSKDLELFYSKYQHLINNITINDNQKHVYSLIFDKKNNFVSDFYESQRQPELLERDQLITENGAYYFSMPIFKDSKVHSNIIINIDFTRYIGTVFNQYRLENTLWQWLITDEGEIVSTFGNDLIIDPQTLESLSNEILEGNEGSLVHTVRLNGEPVKVVSAYSTIRLIRRDLGIVFSMKTDLFLQSIYRKIFIITAASILLMILILYINFRIIKVKSSEARKHEISEQALHNSIDHLPVGIVVVNQDQTIRIINRSATDLLLLNPDEEYIGKNINKVIPEDLAEIADTFYYKAFGEGVIFKVANESHENLLFRQESTSEIDGLQLIIIAIYNITYFEKVKKFNNIAHHAKSGLLENMSHEISVPLNEIKATLQQFSTNKSTAGQKEQLLIIQRSVDLLDNLIKVIMDFSRIEADKIAFEHIPYKLRNEINLAIESFKTVASAKDISIITKIRNEIPDKLIGDPFRLRQVINHLLQSSLENTDMGRILFSAELFEHGHDNIRIKFQIEDTGQGIPVDQLNAYLDDEEFNSIPKDFEPGENGLRLALSKQQVELMKGRLWFESPSSISTNPEFPGTKYSFIIEVMTDIIHTKKLDFGSLHELQNIQCLVLSQINDPEEKSYELLEKFGVVVKQRIYRDDNLDSIIQYLRDHGKAFHILIILDRPETDGFKLAARLFEEKLSENYLMLLISSNDFPGNDLRCRKSQIDYYLTQPFENYTFFEIIRDNFTGISSEVLNNIPKGFRINQDLSILLAEDNLFSRKVNQTLFKSLGFEIDLAENGNDVIEKVKKKKYDIIFMDLLMPGKDGLEAAADLRQMGYNMPIIALTAVETDDTKKLAKQKGINEYLTKPATAESIKKILLDLFTESA